MARVVFTENLRRHTQRPGFELTTLEAPGKTLGEVLSQVFSQQPSLRGYILDDQGRLRKHLLVALDGQLCPLGQELAQKVNPSSEIYIMQALSGG